MPAGLGDHDAAKPPLDRRIFGAATIFAVLDPTLAIAPNGGLFARMVV